MGLSTVNSAIPKVTIPISKVATLSEIIVYKYYIIWVYRYSKRKLKRALSQSLQQLPVQLKVYQTSDKMLPITQYYLSIQNMTINYSNFMN